MNMHICVVQHDIVLHIVSCHIVCQLSHSIKSYHIKVLNIIQYHIYFIPSPSDTSSLFDRIILMSITSQLLNNCHTTLQVRSYMYESVSTAVRNIVNENDSEKLKSENINKSRLQLKVNFPEVNPAFDTYRLGTILEMVRHSSVEECLDCTSLHTLVSPLIWRWI